MDRFSYVQILGVLIIVIGYPILLFIGIWSLPIYVIVSFFLWLICVIGWMVGCINIGGQKKISEYIVPILIMTGIFTLIICSASSEGVIIIAPICSIPAICIVGLIVGTEFLRYRTRVKLEAINNWLKQIIDYDEHKLKGIRKIIEIINKHYLEDNQIEKLLYLFDMCADSQLKVEFNNKAKLKNKTLIGQIDKTISEFALDTSTEGKMIGEILREMGRSEKKLVKKLENEKESLTDASKYKDVKEQYLEFCRNKR